MDSKTLLSDSPENLVRRYRKILLRAGIPVEKMIVFGSYAKKNPRPDSDVDVCVVSKVFGKKPFAEMVRLAHLASDVDTMIEPHPYHPADLEDRYDPLAAEIRRTGITVR